MKVSWVAKPIGEAFWAARAHPGTFPSATLAYEGRPLGQLRPTMGRLSGQLDLSGEAFWAVTAYQGMLPGQLIKPISGGLLGS